MTDLRKKFNNLKKILKNDNYSLDFSGNKLSDDYEMVNGFFKNRLIGSNKIFEFYVNECTGFTKTELREIIFKGKKRAEIKKMKEAIKEAVKYKLLCEL